MTSIDLEKSITGPADSKLDYVELAQRAGLAVGVLFKKIYSPSFRLELRKNANRKLHQNLGRLVNLGGFERRPVADTLKTTRLQSISAGWVTDEQSQKKLLGMTLHGVELGKPLPDVSLVFGETETDLPSATLRRVDADDYPEEPFEFDVTVISRTLDDVQKIISAWLPVPSEVTPDQ